MDNGLFSYDHDYDGHRPAFQRELRPDGVDARGVPTVSREEGASPTRDLRVEALQRAKAIRQLLAVITEEVDELGRMLYSGHGDTRNHNDRVGQPGPALSASPAPEVPREVRAARAAKAAQSYRGPQGPVGGPGSSLR